MNCVIYHTINVLLGAYNIICHPNVFTTITVLFCNINTFQNNYFFLGPVMLDEFVDWLKNSDNS